MYTGWTRAFYINRPLLPKERDRALSRETQIGVEPDEHMSVIHLNSTYLDWIDRRFLYRGTMNTLVAMLTCAVMGSLIFYLLIWEALRKPYWWFGILVSLPSFGLLGYIYYVGLRGEYFTYTHWPIRFNRKTQIVHVFRHNGPDGVLSVPWDQVFFHIGHGTDKKFLLDIRGEVMDGDTVIDTFALGHVADRERPLREMWEFIRRYMDEDPLAAAPHPLERYVGLSVTPTLKNCFLSMNSYYAGGLPRPVQVLVSPFVVLYTLQRWLVLNTCKEPAFPPEVESTCTVDPDDPNIWPIPVSSGQFAADIPGLLEHAEERAKRQWEDEYGLRRPEFIQAPRPRPHKTPVSRRVQRWKKK